MKNIIEISEDGMRVYFVENGFACMSAMRFMDGTTFQELAKPFMKNSLYASYRLYHNNISN